MGHDYVLCVFSHLLSVTIKLLHGKINYFVLSEARVRACERACVRARDRACVRVSVRAYVRACTCAS